MGLTSTPLFNKMLDSPETECRLTSAAWTQVCDGLERATSVHLEVAWVDRRVRALTEETGLLRRRTGDQSVRMHTGPQEELPVGTAMNTTH